MARYGRRFRRGGRPRRFGRRGRSRRPSAARAVPRQSFAPRQQYLKLKHAATYYCIVAQGAGTGPDAAASDYIPINLGQMADPYDQSAILFSGSTGGGVGLGVWWDQYVKQPVLGYNQYSSLFQRYVVNGTKVRINGCVNSPQKVDVGSGVAHTFMGGAFPVTYTRCYAPQAYTTFPADSIWASMPHGKTLTVQNGKFFDKAYISHNHLQGGLVKAHDRYVRNWADTTTQTDAAGAYANWMMYVTVPTTGVAYVAADRATFSVSIRIELTYYVTAQVLYAHEGISPALAALAKSITTPSDSLLGSTLPPPSDRLAAAAAGEVTDLDSLQAVGRIPKRSFTD